MRRTDYRFFSSCPPGPAHSELVHDSHQNMDAFQRSRTCRDRAAVHEISKEPGEAAANQCSTCSFHCINAAHSPVNRNRLFSCYLLRENALPGVHA